MGAEQLMLCNNCGRYYWVEPTGFHEEWLVTLATGETLEKLVAAEPTLRDAINAILTGVLETSWYLAEFVPVQRQAAPGPLCHLPECLGKSPDCGALVETFRVVSPAIRPEMDYSGWESDEIE